MTRRLVLAALIWLVPASPVLAQTGANVLLVVNEASADSGRIAEHYARARGVPPDQVVRVKADVTDEIDRAAFNTGIQAPIGEWLAQHFAQDRILYIVLTKGVPLRIKGTAGRGGSMASVDSELTLLYRRLLNLPVVSDGRVENPFFLGTAPLGQAKPFRRDAFDIYLVTRLDGFTVDDVLGLVDRAAAPSRDGRILLDQKAGTGNALGNGWLTAAAERLEGIGFAGRVALQSADKAAGGEKGVLGYYSWGSNDAAVRTRGPGLAFVPGAIAGMFVSTDARTFIEPPAGWKTGTWVDRATFYAGSPQSLTGDLIRDGVTGVSGHVAEPLLDAAIRPDILFPAYVSGFNLAESFYLAMPYLSWQAVIIGDPLCSPFGPAPLPPAEVDRGLDAATGLPSVFAARRREILAKTTTREAAEAVLRSEASSARGDKAGAQAALEEATRLDPKLVMVHLMLAGTYESQQEYDKAIERYRLVLAASPDHLVALNNLAYGLAVRKGDPGAALGYAERVVRLSAGRSLEAVDTLAWVQHLLGRDAEAAELLDRVVKTRPDHAVFQLHAAVVYAAVGRLPEAADALREAVRLDPELEKSEEARALRGKLGR